MVLNAIAKPPPSLKYTDGDGYLVLSEVPLSGIGYDSRVDLYWGGACSRFWLHGGSYAKALQNYVREKTLALQKFMPRQVMHPTKQSWCILM